MPTQRGSSGTYYIKRRLGGIGLVYRSLGTKRKTRARQLEDAVVKLHDLGRLDIVRAFHDGRLDICEVVEAYESGTVRELAAKLRKPASVSLKDACRSALKTKAPDVKPGTLERYQAGLGHYERIIGADVPVAEALTEDQVQEFKTVRLREVKRGTINKDLIALSVLLTHATGKGWIDERPDVGRYTVPSRMRHLAPDEWNVFIAAVRRPFRTQFMLLVGTGMRLGETENLRVCDVRLSDDGAGDRLEVRDAKTASGIRTVYLPDWVADALREEIGRRGLSGADPIFRHYRRRLLQSEHARACKIAGIADYRLHDHRHTAAVSLARAGMPLHLIQGQLGHKHIAETMKYAAHHPAYNDVASYFREVGRAWAPGRESGNTTPSEAPTEVGVEAT